ncbi:M4 family metallopeptidase [Flavobacterium sp.]|uniref:M4 family metallopeptidase n=1 Tax=Flavobacterium sp. TaxID=239 RepID=UPI003752C63D
MKKKLCSLGTLTVISMFTLSTMAQETDKNVNSRERNANGTPYFVSFKENSKYKKTDYQAIFKEQLGLKENQNFSKIKTDTDDLGFIHEKFQLFHQDIKVEFATYTLHSKNGKVATMSGEFYNIENVNTNPSITEEAALINAKKIIGAQKYLWETPDDAKSINYQKPKGELVLLPSIKGIKLAYKFDIYATIPISRGDIYIDAITGESLFYNATIKHLGEHSNGKGLSGKNNLDNQKKNTSLALANAALRYSGAQTLETTLNGSSYVLSDPTRGNGVQTFNSARTASYPSTNFTDADNNWTATEFNNLNKDNGALDAHWGAEKTYDYFKNVHNRNSFNNSGGAIRSYVHYNLVAAGYPDNNNAFWNGSVMTYGDGTGTGGFDMLTSLDVAAHEIGHAVCENTANLTYQNESGAMNEGFSDIWAACVEYYAAPNKQTWLIGEDIEKRTGHASLRSMSNPKIEGQPDTYKGISWYSGAADNGGVHYNSGVLNHWFYILSIGKSGTNDKGNVFNVTGITIEKASKIAYRLESNYLSSNATYASARTGGIQAAIDIYGAGAAEVIATTNAFYAVGIGAAYTSMTTDTTTPSSPTSLIASGTTNTTTNLSWSAATDNVGITSYDIYKGNTLIASTTSNVITYEVSGLTAATTFTFAVKAKDAAGNISLESNTVNVTTTASVVTYCSSKGNNVTDEFIDYVALRNVTNTTAGNMGYGNFTNLIANLPYGTNLITYSAGFNGTPYKEFWKVWIDFNKNGTFETTEQIVSRSSSSSSNLITSFIVPSTALSGTTLMRVSMKYNATSSACETFSYGEVEDYTVNIGTTSTATIADFGNEITEEKKYDFEMHPNPAVNSLTVSILDNREVSYKIYNTIGQIIKSDQLKEAEINVSDMVPGLYILEVNDGQKTISKKFIKK